MKHYVQGTFFSVTTICEEGHTVQWTSQKKIGKRSEGNIVIGAALTLSGILFAQMSVFCQSINLAFFSRTTYNFVT